MNCNVQCYKGLQISNLELHILDSPFFQIHIWGGDLEDAPFQKAMIHVSAETINLWAVCISSIVEDRDPRRFSRLVTMATEEFLSGRTIFHDTSFVTFIILNYYCINSYLAFRKTQIGVYSTLRYSWLHEMSMFIQGGSK